MLLSSNGIAVTSFAAPEVWSALVQVFIIALAVLAGNILRRKVKILRRSLIPSALLGGWIILLLKMWADFNGIIDKFIIELRSAGRINKSGRGLIDPSLLEDLDMPQTPSE